MVPIVFPTLLPDADPNLVEFCKNLLFASHHKECATASELLQKVVALKCIQDSNTMSSPSTSSASSSRANVPSFSLASLAPSTSSANAPKIVIERPEARSFSDTPVFFNSMTAVLQNLSKAGVDPIVAESIALDRLCSPSANPLSFMSKVVINGVEICAVDEVTAGFVKNVLKRLHDHENFTVDGAPYPFDVKSALRYSEHLHSQIPPLGTVNPTHLAHEQSITFAAMSRFMAMHEINIDLKLLFPVESHVLDETAYYSALFWTYREALKTFYYPKMPAPLPPNFQLTPQERQILCRYWNAGNRHVTVSESMLLARRCPSLAPYQVYGFFDKRRRREYNRYRGIKDDETLAFETTQVWRKLREMKQKCDDEDSDDDDDLFIQREFLSRDDNEKLQLLWQLGHRKPSRNECEILAADMQINNGEQIFAYFEDRRWRDDFQKSKTRASSSNSSLKR